MSASFLMLPTTLWSSGEFNGDGNLDFAVASPVDSKVFVFSGNGDGTFKQGGRPTMLLTHSLL